MMLVRDGGALPAFSLPPVVTLGNFDGVHLGHAKVIRTARAIAGEKGGPVLAVTFDPHPEHVISPGTGPMLLTTPEEKCELMKEAGVDILWMLPFSAEFASIPAESFLRDWILERTKTRNLVLGYDHRFGRNGEGTFDLAEKVCRVSGVEATRVAPEIVNGKPVSSTWVRKWVAHGDFNCANLLLGHPYLIAGKVERGHGRGREIGFPTVNIGIACKEKLLPVPGVYFAAVSFSGKCYDGAFYIGRRETFEEGPIVLEAHLLNFSGDLYGAQVLVYVIEKLRDSRRFESAAKLAEQIGRDVETVKNKSTANRKEKPLEELCRS